MFWNFKINISNFRYWWKPMVENIILKCKLSEIERKIKKPEHFIAFGELVKVKYWNRSFKGELINADNEKLL